MTTTDMAMFSIFIVALIAMRMIWLETIKDNENDHK